MNGSMMMMLQKLPTLLMATFKLAGREKIWKVTNAGCRNIHTKNTKYKIQKLQMLVVEIHKKIQNIKVTRAGF